MLEPRAMLGEVMGGGRLADCPSTGISLAGRSGAGSWRGGEKLAEGLGSMEAGDVAATRFGA
ncbi:MAG: hypothetical protein JO310_17425 [Hyphomicrobiales bacterium]|nr:hypothetical protein [Acidobacteriaceae bacterium]MBV9591377.1 hypothetical protein [Hyphomicrobiales bacterium]